MLENRLIICRKFDNYDDGQRVIELAIPVEICECSAHKISEKSLDPLAEAILGLISIGISSDAEIAKVLNIGIDLIKLIKKSILLNHLYLENDCKRITEAGKQYLHKGEGSEYQTEKVFGNMFVSLADREVMPYFLEGKIPSNRFLPNDICKIMSNDEDKLVIQDLTKWSPKFIKAYKLYAKINRYSDDDSKNEIEFAEDEFHDVLYHDVKEKDESIVTFAESESEKNSASEDNLIKLLNTTHKQIYLKTKLIFKRENPETFVVVSPFEKNTTSWFTKRIMWLKENNVKVICENNKEILLKDLLDDITQEFFIEFPELQEGNFDYWLSMEHPNLKRIKCRDNLINSFKELFNLNNLYDNGKQVGESMVIMRAYVLLETIFNNYIYLIPNRRLMLDKCSIIYSGANRAKEIFNKFGIENCAAARGKKLDNLLMNLLNFSDRRVGDSIIDRYFFLTLEAYFIGLNPFKNILDMYGSSLTDKLDYIFIIRSKYGAHNDEIIEKNVPIEEFTKFRKEVKEVLRILIDGLLEEEKINV